MHSVAGFGQLVSAGGRSRSYAVLLIAACGVLSFTLGGCPTNGSGVSNPIGGPTETASRATGEASVQIFAPSTSMSISGGVPIEVSYRATSETTTATVELIFDLDDDPENGNEFVSLINVPISETSAVLDTSLLDVGTYLVGVTVREQGGISAFAYAPAQITVNQAPRLQFLTPRSNFVFDRSLRINPSFTVSWEVTDPDSTISTRIVLDSDLTTTGDEVILRESDSQTGDSFSFQLRTDLLEPGRYNIVALISDGNSTTQVVAPGAITLRSRLSGYVDLRDLDDPSSGKISGAVFEGFNPRDNSGSFLRGIEDIDGDGLDDFITVAQFGKPDYEFDNVRNGIGEAYLVFGTQERFTGRVNLNSTGVLFRGEVFEGVPQQPVPIRPSRGITSVDLVDDMDFDGVRELAFGLPFTDSLSEHELDPDGYFRTGGVIVMAGSSLRPDLGFPGGQVIELIEVGTLPHVFQNCTGCDAPSPCECPEGFYGPKAVANCASFDGGTSATYYNEHFPARFILNGQFRLGARYSTNIPFDQFGETVRNYDFRSLIFSSPNRDPLIATTTALSTVPGAGTIHLYFFNQHVPWNTQNAAPANAAFNYPGSGNLNNRFIQHGGPYHNIVDDFDLYPIPGTGTLDPDTGLLVSSFRFGSPGWTVDPSDSAPCTREVSAGTTIPARTARFWSSSPGTNLSNVEPMGDFNADGILDIAIGAPFIEDTRGSTFIVYGRLPALMTTGELEIQELALAMRTGQPFSERIFDGLRVVGDLNDRLGQSQVPAGDFNGDGLSDVAIGSPNFEDKVGACGILFGSRTLINLTQREIPFSELGDANTELGVIFVGEEIGDQAGLRLANTGDIDGDGFDDLLIAAPNRSVRLDLDQDGEIEVDRRECGVVYLVYGNPTLTGRIDLSQVGTEQLPGAVFIGPASGYFLGSGVGDGGERSFGITGAGDADGDGFRDLLFSSNLANPRDRLEAGETYLIYGSGD
jgi:hypothetical protein